MCHVVLLLPPCEGCEGAFEDSLDNGATEATTDDGATESYTIPDNGASQTSITLGIFLLASFMHVINKLA